MTICYVSRTLNHRRQLLCCYGAQGCTAAPLSSNASSSVENTVTGLDPKQERDSEQPYPHLRLSLSDNAQLQDLYLILRGLSDGGFEVSVTVQATPSKQYPHLPLGTREQFGCLITECPCIESQRCLDAVTQHLKSTTPSSKQRGSSKTSKPFCIYCGGEHDMRHCYEEEPRNRRY